MSKLPTVAIIGKPNAGKSTLFNALSGTRRAIVNDIAGTTRDHVVSEVHEEKMDYLLVDTGGIGGGSEDHDLEEDVSTQSVIAVEHADLIVFTVNSREELTSADFAVVEILRKKKRKHVPIILALTKCDNPEDTEMRMPQFYELGISENLMMVSAVHRAGIQALQDKIVEILLEMHFMKQPERTERDAPRIAIVGKPNVGKSSLINALMSDPQRAETPRLVSDIAGTTRDPSDTTVRFDGIDYIFVDTAGLRRKARVEEDIESIAHLKTMQSIASSDIVVLVLDATQPTSQQEKRIAATTMEEGKGMIIILNKIDLLTTEKKAERMKELSTQLAFCSFAPVLCCSAETRDGLLKLFPLIESVHRNLHRRISTGDLRRWYSGCVQRLPARALSQGKHVMQAKDIPPTFVVFVKNPRLIQKNQLRYLERTLRETFAFEGAPVRWITK